MFCPCLTHSQIKKNGNVSFSNYFFILKNIQHYIHKKIFNSFTTNFHLIIFQLSLSSIQLDLNLVVELNLVALEFNSIQFKFQSMYLNTIPFKMHAMDMGYGINMYCNKVLNQCTSCLIMHILLIFSRKVCNNFRVHMTKLKVAMDYVN